MSIARLSKAIATARETGTDEAFRLCVTEAIVHGDEIGLASSLAVSLSTVHRWANGRAIPHPRMREPVYKSIELRLHLTASTLVICPRCSSEVDVGGCTSWPEPGERDPGERVEIWVSCNVEDDDGNDPMGEFDDGEPCGEDILVARVVLPSGHLGDCEVVP